MFKNKKAFTMVELMMVSVVLGIVASLAVPTYQSVVEQSRGNEAKVNLNIIHMGEKLYSLNNGGAYSGPGNTNINNVNGPAALNMDMSVNYFGTINVTAKNPATAGYVATFTRTGGTKSFTYDYDATNGNLTCKEDGGVAACR